MDHAIETKGLRRVFGALTAVDNFYPVAWSDLDYHEDRQGYVLPYGIEELEDDGVSAMFELIDDDGAQAR